MGAAPTRMASLRALERVGMAARLVYVVPRKGNGWMLITGLLTDSIDERQCLLRLLLNQVYTDCLFSFSSLFTLTLLIFHLSFLIPLFFFRDV